MNLLSGLRHDHERGTGRKLSSPTVTNIVILSDPFWYSDLKLMIRILIGYSFLEMISIGRLYRE